MLDPVGCTVGKVAGDAAQSTWDSFTQWVGQGLTDLAATVFEAFSASTTPDFGVGWFREYVDTLVLVSLPILALFFVLQVITAVVRREVGYLGRAIVGVVIGAAGVPLALALVEGLSSFVDGASAYLIRRHSPGGFQRLFEVSALVAAGSGGGFVLVAMFLAIFAMFALYLVLLLRKVALLAIVVFAPLALVGWTWHSTRSWLRRWVEVTAALLISKFAMAVVFSLGLSAIGGAGQQGVAGTIGDLLAGVVLLGIAAFAPWACFHFLHWAGTESASALHRSTHRGTTAMRQEATRARHALHRATAHQQSSNGSSSPNGSSASGLRHVDANGQQGGGSRTSSSSAPKPQSNAGQGHGSTANAGTGGAAKAGRGGAAAGSASSGSGASAAGASGAGAGAAGGAAAGVQAAHTVAKGIKDTGEQAGAAVEQHTEASKPAQSTPGESHGVGSADRATNPTSSKEQER